MQWKNLVSKIQNDQIEENRKAILPLYLPHEILSFVICPSYAAALLHATTHFPLLFLLLVAALSPRLLTESEMIAGASAIRTSLSGGGSSGEKSQPSWASCSKINILLRGSMGNQLARLALTTVSGRGNLVSWSRLATSDARVPEAGL